MLAVMVRPFSSLIPKGEVVYVERAHGDFCVVRYNRPTPSGRHVGTFRSSRFRFLQ